MNLINNKKVVGVIINKNTKKVEDTTKLSDAELLYAKSPFYKCPEIITKFVINHGGFPLLMIYDEDFSDKYLNMIDGLLLIGDKDISKDFYGKKDLNEDIDEVMNKDKMKFQIKMLDKILIKKEKEIPILGICAGLQSLNVALGGTLYNDIKENTGSKVIHNPKFINPHQKAHKIKINKETILYNILKKEELDTTSNHHQAIEKIGKNLKVSAKCIDDGIIESIEYSNSKFCLGVQWHIERESCEEDSLIMKEFMKNL